MPKQVTDEQIGEIVKRALSVATIGTIAEVQLQIAHNAVRATIKAIQSPPVGDELVELIERLQQEPVLVADQEPFVEIWESDFRQIMAALLSINGQDHG